MLKDVAQKWKDLVNKANKAGLPIPTIRDPKTGVGSVSLTLVLISALLVIVGILSKWAGKLGGIEMNSAMQFFWTSVSLYWGRKFQGKAGTLGDSDDQNTTGK